MEQMPPMGDVSMQQNQPGIGGMQDMNQPQDGGQQMPADDSTMDNQFGGDEFEMGDEGSGDAMNSETSEIDDLWNKLDTERRNTLLKYGESMIDDDEEDELPQGEEQPMMEAVFTKGQLNKIYEIFGEVDDDNDDRKKPEKADKNNKRTPFSNPIFDK